jgi:NADPH:quinone reductase-like Zn-dependent oxidoreductase
MKAIRLHQPTGIEGLTYEDAPDAQPAIGDLLVKVHAAGITASELYWPIWNDPLGHKRESIIPAQEFSGVVLGLGWGTAGFDVGDEVFGLTSAYRDGAAAELIAVEARDVALKPKSVDHVHAAAVPQAGLTSWQALFTHGRLSAGQTVVIHGAAGAVGCVAVQLAHNAGARVIGTGRANAEAVARDMGADMFVDLERDGWDKAIGQVDVVFDTIGGEVLERSVNVVKSGGALVTVAGALPTQQRTDIRCVNFVRESDRRQLQQLAEMVDNGTLRPPLGAVYPLAETQKAFAEKSGHRVIGRVILQP